MAIGIGIAIAIANFNEDRDRNRDLSILAIGLMLWTLHTLDDLHLLNSLLPLNGVHPLLLCSSILDEYVLKSFHDFLSNFQTLNSNDIAVWFSQVIRIHQIRA